MKKLVTVLLLIASDIAISYSQNINEVWQKFDLKGDSAYIIKSGIDYINFAPLANLEPLKLIDKKTGEAYPIQSYNWYMIINYEMFKSSLYSGKNKAMLSGYSNRLKPKDKVVIDEIVYSNSNSNLPKQLTRVIF